MKNKSDVTAGPDHRSTEEPSVELPIDGHRALAEEYEQIAGIPQGSQPSKDIQQRMLRHRSPEDCGLSALCLSGGGIRSASFCLGAIQVLADRRLFGQFHYLSTVSGGGYLGTGITRWLTAKVTDDHQSPAGALAGVERELGELRCKDYVGSRTLGREFEEEGPLTWLRMHTNYLARRLSLFSADAWTILSTYLRNLLVVWMIFWPWVTLFLLVPWLTVLVYYHETVIETYPRVAGVVGAVVGIFASTYLMQPGASAVVAAKRIKWPKEPDNRAFFGALLLVAACSCLSYVIWWDLDRNRRAWFSDVLAPEFLLLFAVFMLTQGWLAFRRRSDGFVRSLVAAFFAAVVQVGLIFLIAIVLVDWGDNGDLLHKTLQSLFTPTAIMIALVTGETVKTALRSHGELPQSREYQGRAQGFMVILIAAWLLDGAIVVLAPPLLGWSATSGQAYAVTGGGISLTISVYLGYRPISPGAPDARPRWYFTALGVVGILLLSMIVSIAAWNLLERVAGTEAPARCECAPKSANNGDSEWQDPVDQRVCQIANTQCFEKSFGKYFYLPFGSHPAYLAWFCVALAVSGAGFFGFSRLIRMNEFSLHGFYRDRLIRAFYGGFRGKDVPRSPERFTGFDPKDDIDLTTARSIHEYPQWGMKYSQWGIRPPPFLVVNAALNMVKGTTLAWQERKADSFTFTALHAGNYRLGYRPVGNFGGGVKLGTAMAISGAAFNPNMGYNSSTPLAFLMSVFNVRLGWWLGNPRKRDWRKKDPVWSSWQLLQEAAGQTADRGNWIHLSDGGHFDNVGLWEMVHRRCRNILVIDATCDKQCSLEDFYSAIRKIRVDMGIEIEPYKNEPIQLFPRSARAAGMYHARFTIKYYGINKGKSDPGLDGTIIYLKPCFYGREPPDVLEYAEKNSDFPHETTLDQFFGEAQFESYRKLGEYEMEQTLRKLLVLEAEEEPEGLARAEPIRLLDLFSRAAPA